MRMVYQCIEKVKVGRGSSILILEDDPKRHKVFLNNLIGCAVTIVDTVEAAIDELSHKEFDALFLDHDLNGEQMVESGEGTGYMVALWLTSHPNCRPDSIVIHNFNPVGSENMHLLLPGSQLIPGAWGLLEVVD